MSRQLLFKKIHVIESLPPNEMRTGKDLNDDCLHYNSFRLTRMKHKYTRVKTKAEFFDSLNGIRQDMVPNDESPIIHLELHGNENGLVLADGDFVQWLTLKKWFKEINLLCKNNLFLTLAVCKGAYLLDIIDFFEAAPYWGFLAPREVISVGSVLVAFSSFYTELFQTLDMNKARNRLNESLAGKQDNSFEFINCELLFCKLFRKYQTEMCSEALITERVEKQYQQYVQQTGNRDIAVRAFLRMKLTSKEFEESTFYKYKNHFLMIGFVYAQNSLDLLKQ